MHLTKCIPIFLIISLTGAAEILGISPFPIFSQFQLGDRIYKELVERGHNVTVITPYKEKTPIDNFKQILIEDVFEKVAEKMETFSKQHGSTIVGKVIWFDTLSVQLTEVALNSSSVKQFLQLKNHFDLVITQQIRNDAHYGFCHHFKAPCVALMPMPSTNWFSDMMGNSAPPSYVPQLLLSYTSSMNFFQRTRNAVVYVLEKLSNHFYRYPAQNYLLQKYFSDAPHLDHLYYNLSLILFNGHISVGDAVPLLPNTIDIAGYHINPPQNLPDDLQQYLDEGSEGVIYFSMGSNLRSRDFSEANRIAINKVFSELKQRVIWKWEDDHLPDQPSNVLIRSWLPQQDILAHPNVVLFITHGGVSSTIETVYHGKPILGLPVFSDQSLNMAKAEKAGYGRFIMFEDLYEERFREELHEVLRNPIYTENAKMRSKLMRDQPLSPLDKAIFWIEYVLRLKGAPHLKSQSLSLSWYQYYLLDVMFAFIVSLGLLLTGIRMVCNS